MVTQEGLLQYLADRGATRTVEIIATVQKMPVPKRNPQSLLHPDPVIPIGGEVTVEKEPDTTNLDPLKLLTSVTPLGMASNFLDLWSNVAEGNDISTTGANILSNVATTTPGSSIITGSPEDVSNLINTTPSLQNTNVSTGENTGSGLLNNISSGFDFTTSLDMVGKALPIILILGIVGGISRIFK